MQKYQDVVLRADGRPAAGATIAVRNYPANTVATIYSDNGVTPIAGGGVVADDSGEYAFYAANGRYSLIISYPGFAGETRSDILLFDPSDTLYFPGNVGIGITPSFTLDVYRSSTTTSIVTARNDTSTTVMYATSSASFAGTATNTPFGFVTNNAERMRIDSSGNVGIGTSTLVGGIRLTVLGGGTQLSPGTAAQEGLRIQRATGYATLTGINNDNNAYNGLQLFTGASAAVTVDTSGNVGIGTASPVAGYVLNVVNDSGNAQQLIRAGTNFNSTISFGDQSSSTSGQVLYAHNGDYMRFDTNGSERMRIDSSGNVGIGIAPSYVLDTYRSSTTTVSIAARNDTSTTLLYATNAASFVGTTTNTPFGFITNNAERMRIDSSGNIVAGASAALATNATNGFLYVPTCAGTPTGVPTAITGMAPIVVNTTNNKMYFYSGGAWRDAGP